MRQALELALKFVEDSECGTADLEAKIKEALAQPERDYERGFIDGMQKQMQSSVDKAVNRMAQPEQEPVAYLSNKRQRINIEIKPQTFVEIPTVTDWEMPLYMKPPQRTWVGLTEEELYEIYDESDDGSSPCGVCGACSKCKIEVSIARAIEAKLKEKNNG